LNAEGVGISSISRVLGYSKGTISRKILELSKRVVRPIYAHAHSIPPATARTLSRV